VVLMLGYPRGRRWASRTLTRSPLECTAFRVALCLRCPHRRAGRLRPRSPQRDYGSMRFGSNRLHELGTGGDRAFRPSSSCSPSKCTAHRVDLRAGYPHRDARVGSIVHSRSDRNAEHFDARR
jgi:hypothetical protein